MLADKLFGSTLELLGKSIDLRARKHSMISGNLANAETPGYTPSTLDFEAELKHAVQTKLGKRNSTPPHPRHIPLKGQAAELEAVRGRVMEVPAGPAGRDGNGVELEAEMSRMMENQILYNASVQILAKKFEGLKTAIRDGR